MDRFSGTLSIAGGAGFIGTNLLRIFLDEYPDADFRVIDNFSSGNRGHAELFANEPRVSFFELDLKEQTPLVKALEGSNLVVHLAANPNIAAAETQPDIDFWNGTLLTQNLLEAMRLSGVKHMIYASGSGVYGEVPESISENYGPCIPISTYGASKLACESLISAYCHMFDMRARTLRFANVVGPRQTHGIGYDFLRRLSDGLSPLKVLGDGTQTKSYVHVDDVTEAVFLLIPQLTSLDHPEYDVYNVATNDRVSVSEIAELAIIMISPGVEAVYGVGPRGWKGDVPVIGLDTKKIRSLGWAPQRSSRDAIIDSINAMAGELGVEVHDAKP
jgi:UDP-glucose 4-epimerase